MEDRDLAFRMWDFSNYTHGDKVANAVENASTAGIMDDFLYPEYLPDGLQTALTENS